MKIFRVLAALLLLGSPVAAQTAGQYPAGTVLGNATGARALAAPSATPILGLPGTTLGTLRLSGNTSGTATIRPQAAAGTPTLTLPNTSGTFAVNASAPLSLSATTGALTLPGAAGQVLAGATPAFTATPTLGVAGATLGTLTLAGNTSGSVLITPQATAGSPTLTLPNTSGTFAVVASAPLALSATTGTLTITGAAGQVLAGATPAFTATPTLGVNGGTGGQITLSGSTSGTGIIRVAAAAGAGIVFQLPTTNGSSTNVLSTDGAGVTSWVAGGAGTVTSVICGTGLTGGTITSTGTCAVDIATGSNFLSGTASKIVDAAVIYQAETTTTFAATQTMDFNTFYNTKITLTANITSFSCSNQKAGQSGTIRFIQDGTGSRTLPATFGCNMKFAGGTQPVLTTTASLIDALVYSCSATNYCVASLIKNVQ